MVLDIIHVPIEQFVVTFLIFLSISGWGTDKCLHEYKT